MDDLRYGSRNKRGDWAPNQPLEVAPFWHWPISLPKLLAWLPGYLWPWNVFHMAVTLAYWAWIIPDVETMKILSWGWTLWLYAVNAGAIFGIFGSVELFYYVKRRQGARFKYNARFPSENPSDVFWFKSQSIDNFLRSFCFSIPLWTLCEVLVLHAYAAGYVPWMTWADTLGTWRRWFWPWLRFMRCISF